MDIVQFRCNFPEFFDASIYTDELLNLWAVAAEALVDLSRWGTMRELATNLVLAHFVVLAIKDQNSGEKGSVPGASAGFQTMKKVGEVSVSYDANVNSESGSGNWNETTYGQRYISLVKIFGAGALQL